MFFLGALTVEEIGSNSSLKLYYCLSSVLKEFKKIEMACKWNDKTTSVSCKRMKHVLWRVRFQNML